MPANYSNSQPEASGKVYSAGFHVDPINSQNDLESFHRKQEDHYVKPYSQRYPQHEQQTRQATSSRAAQPPPPEARRPRTPPKYTPGAENDKYTAANLRATQRKPVPSHDPKIGPAPTTHQRTVSAESLGLKRPESQGSEQVAAGAQRYINVTADGKWDPQSIQQGAARPTGRSTPPPSYPTGRSTPPPSYRTPSPNPNSRPTTPDAPRRPKRTDSNGSAGSITSGIKRLGSDIRRKSNDFFEGISRAAELAKLGEGDRRMIKKNKATAANEAKRQRSKEREEACRENPDLRPPHEKAALLERNQKHGHLKSDAFREAGEAAATDQLHCNRRIKAEVARCCGEDDDETKKSRKGSQDSHDSLNMEKRHALSEAERIASRRKWGIPETEAKGFDAYDKLGDKAGKWFDPMRRKGSGDSDFMGDTPPAGSMEECQECGSVPQHNLRHGKCEDCLLRRGRKRVASGRR